MDEPPGSFSARPPRSDSTLTTRLSPPRLERRSDDLRLLLIGVDHRCAPLELREKVAYAGQEAQSLLRRLEAAEEISEVCLLSTCNRTEVYLLPRRDGGAYRLALAEVFIDKAPEIEAEGRFYVKRGGEAARHLFEVACGLRSMVLGEPEILGQVKSAARRAEDAVTSGAVLQRLLRSAVAAGGRVRHETAISAGAISFGYALADLARTSFGRLDGCSVLMLGAGETARQVSRNLTERGVRKLMVSNRSTRRAEEFLALFPDSRLVPFAERTRVLDRVDVVVATTSASQPVLRRTEIANALGSRRVRPLLVADLGVPRNVEVAAGELDGVLLQDLDSLEGQIAHNLEHRRQEVPRALPILDRELELFLSWYRRQAAEPLVEALQKRAEDIRRREVKTVRDSFPPETHDDLERLTRSLVRKLLHHPSAHLRSTERSGHRRLQAVRDLFQLDPEE